MESSSPLISVIVPVYNQGHYLAAALQSLRAQSYPFFEAIVVDDGSTDNSAEVAQSIEDTRFRYIYQENAGLSAARNAGLRAAKGSFVSFLDSDDLFLPTKLARLLAHFEQYPNLGFVSGHAILIDQEGRQLESTLSKALPGNSQLLLGNPIHVGSVLIRRAWMERVLPFDETLRSCEDWDMWLRLVLAGCPVGSVAEDVSLYRVHGQQMTRQAQRMRTAMFAVLDKVFARAELPPEWQHMRERAYAAAHLKAAARAYLANELPMAKSDLAAAVRLDPSLLDDCGDPLVNQLMGWADAPTAGDPLTYMERVYENLPDTLRRLDARRRRDLSHVAMRMAFEAYRKGDYVNTCSAALYAIRQQPTWSINRSVQRILFRSVLSLQWLGIGKPLSEQSD